MLFFGRAPVSSQAVDAPAVPTSRVIPGESHTPGSHRAKYDVKSLVTRLLSS